MFVTANYDVIINVGLALIIVGVDIMKEVLSRNVSTTGVAVRTDLNDLLGAISDHRKAAETNMQRSLRSCQFIAVLRSAEMTA